MRRRTFEGMVADVMGFLVAKGLLISSDCKPKGSAKLFSHEVMRVAEEYEPRVLEVLPAAIIHFPRSFRDKEKFPPQLFEVVNRIKKGSLRGPNFNGIRYSQMRRWAEITLADKRARPLRDQRKLISFRLKPSQINRLKIVAKEKGQSATGVLQELLDQI